MTKPTYPSLEHMFGAYLHQDFDLDYGTAEGAVAAFAAEASEERLAGARYELEMLIGQLGSKCNVGELLLRMGCCYNPCAEHPTEADWLKAVLVQLDKAWYGTRDE
jgi:hypothetical protein